MAEIKSAIEKLKGFYMNDSCHEDFNECICYECKEHCEDGKPIILAINSLNAWEEVLTELEKQKDVYKLVSISSTAMGKAYTYDESTICMAINIIKSKLEGVTE